MELFLRNQANHSSEKWRWYWCDGGVYGYEESFLEYQAKRLLRIAAIPRCSSRMLRSQNWPSPTRLRKFWHSKLVIKSFKFWSVFHPDKDIFKESLTGVYNRINTRFLRLSGNLLKSTLNHYKLECLKNIQFLIMEKSDEICTATGDVMSKTKWVYKIVFVNK